jgi:hypothetical protein
VKRLAILAAVAVLAACDDTNVHLLYGQEYDQQYKCMLPTTSIDVLNGPDPGQNCAPECITATLDGQDYVYITTSCPPYDPYPAEKQTGYHGPTDPCTPAFAAYAANIECSPDGGPPEGGADAGTDADAGFDATVDGGSDAQAEAAPESGPETSTDAQGGGDAAADGPGE